VPMAELRTCLEELGFHDVVTYIASGNVIVRSNKTPAQIQALIEAALPTHFMLDSELVRVLVLDHAQLQSMVSHKPAGFGERPDRYYSDAIFLMGIEASEAMAVFSPREGVDTIWPGDGIIYSQRLSAERTKSRLGKIVGTIPYKSMTIRSWNTVTKLLELLQASESKQE